LLKFNVEEVSDESFDLSKLSYSDEELNSIFEIFESMKDSTYTSQIQSMKNEIENLKEHYLYPNRSYFSHYQYHITSFVFRFSKNPSFFKTLEEAINKCVGNQSFSLVYFFNSDFQKRFLDKTVEKLKEYNSYFKLPTSEELGIEVMIKDLEKATQNHYSFSSFSEDPIWSVKNYIRNDVHQQISNYGFLYNKLAKYSVDLENDFFLEAINTPYVSRELKMNLIKDHIAEFDYSKLKNGTTLPIPISSDDMMEMDKELLKTFFNKAKHLLYGEQTLLCYKLLGPKNYIDQMIKSDYYEVRNLAIQYLEPTDKRLVIFFKDSSKTNVCAALEKVHISQIPLFFGSKMLKNSQVKRVFEARMTKRV
jgi:hypothetical protein